MFRLRLDRETVTKAVTYHTAENYGLTALTETDEDLLTWFRWVLAKVGGYDLADLAQVGMTMQDDALTLTLPAEQSDLLDVIRDYVL